MDCPFGGHPNHLNRLSAATTSAPAQGYRVIPGIVWWNLVFWPWRQYIAARAMALPVSPPRLSPPGATGVYFTDIKSLEGLLSAGEFAKRLGLGPQAQRECHEYGCAVVEFNVVTPPPVSLPPPAPGALQGLTTGGAREWLTNGNVEVDDGMRVTYIDWTHTGARYFEIPL
jgi:hypothetical protein